MKTILRAALLALSLSAPLLAQTPADPSADASAAAQPSAGSPDSCKRIWDISMKYYRMLASYLPPSFKLYDQLPSHQFLKLKGDGCDQPGTTSLYTKVVSVHSQRIGVLLPFGRWSSSTQKNLLAWLKEYVRSQGLDPEKNVIWLDTGGKVQTMQEQLAQLVYVQHVSSVIGGLTVAEAPVLAKWADHLRIPTIVLNKKFDPPNSKFVFRLGPDTKQLARSLMSHAAAKGYKRIAIIMPQSSRDGTFADAIRADAPGKFETVGPFFYSTNDFNSIDQIFRKLFHINDDSRRQEMLDLITDLKEKAKKEGVSFDSKGLMLPPVVDIDALVIIDNFKDVRHIAKTLNFYGVSKLPLLGIPKWRAPELVDQDEPNLVGAVFVDYIGSYRSLPYGIRGDYVGDENFVEGAEASLIDLKLVVTHALAAALETVKGPRIARYALAKRIENAVPQDKTFFRSSTIFAKNHEAYWPSYLFTVSPGHIQSLSEPVAVRNKREKTVPH